MLMAVMTVYRIVLVHGVEALKMMSVVSVAVTIAFVLTVLVFQTVLHMKMSVMFVMMMHLTTVYRIVRVHGAVIL